MNFRHYNIIEVKTEQDRLEVADLCKLMAYGWLYMAKHEITSASGVTLTALVHHLPAKTLSALPELNFVQQAKGIYVRSEEPIAYVIAFSDLPEELLPEELLAFCDAKRRRELFLSGARDEEKKPILKAILDLFEKEVRKMLLDIRVETLRNILSGVDMERIVAALDTDQLISIIGEDRFISNFGEDRLISAIGEDRLISALGKDRIIAAYEKLSSARPKKNSLASRRSKPRAVVTSNKRSKKKPSK